MNLVKPKVFRSKKYLLWVKMQPCVMCGSSADEAHHIKGIGQLSGAGIKAPDSFTIPVCRAHHAQLHLNPHLWPQQWEWIARTLAKAIDENILEVT